MGKWVIFVFAGVMSAAFLLQWRGSPELGKYYRGKRVIITGASRGIGKSLAIQMAQQGVKLLLAARSREKLELTAAKCREHTDTVITVVADVSQEEDCHRIVDTAGAEMGGVDILILNAAYSPVPSFFSDYKSPGEIFSDVYRVNVLQSINMVHRALPHLRKSEGIIVAVSSLSSQIGMPKVSAYSSSKHAFNGFFKSLIQEFAIDNVPVSVTIMPLPYVLTERAVDNWKPIGEGGGISPDECARKMIAMIPLRRTWSYIDWNSYLIGHIYPLFPDLLDSIIRVYLNHTSHLF